MSQSNFINKKGVTSRFLLLTGLAVALWVGLPFVLDLASTTTHAHGDLPTLVATLSGDPIGEATPRGLASYYVAATGTPDPARKLNVTVSDVNLPDATVLQVSLNGSAIGTITLDVDGGPSNNSSFGHGSLTLSTANGGTVPTVAAGDTLTVGSAPALGNVTYLSGTFDAPTPPSPTPTHTPWPTHTPFPTPSHTPFPTPSHTPFPTPSNTPSPMPSGTPLPPRTFAARLTGASEVPPVTSNGFGFGFVLLNTAETQIRVCIGTSHLSSAVTAITINGPASTTENGPVIFTLTLPTNSFGFSSQTFDVTADQVAQLRADSWYFQVATTDNADGEIRGQIDPIVQHHSGGPHGGGGGGDGDRMVPAGQIFDTDDADSRAYVAVPFDFDEDGISDIAVFRNGGWDITLSSTGNTVSYETE